ncbi:hypothetical protein L2E82_14358 [Cichorium intybus]|uniref:Uncharacterized protein n=1 Tax=Cichorium intybus TaxID=13427 RepID=A0ACB9F0Y5_CICIN|nr:hypothetical protein L2E82_14358 [Cichorium intybus]
MVVLDFSADKPRWSRLKPLDAPYGAAIASAECLCVIATWDEWNYDGTVRKGKRETGMAMIIGLVIGLKRYWVEFSPINLLLLGPIHLAP